MSCHFYLNRGRRRPPFVTATLTAVAGVSVSRTVWGMDRTRRTVQERGEPVGIEIGERFIRVHIFPLGEGDLTGMPVTGFGCRFLVVRREVMD